MTILLLITFIAECLVLIGWGFRNKSRFCQFPFLAAVIFLSFIAPQFVAVFRITDLPISARDRALIMSILCLGMCYLGHQYARAIPTQPQNFFKYDQIRLMHISVVLTLIGSVFYYTLNRIYHSDVDISGGMPTKYFFFAALLNYGFAIAVIQFLRNKSLISLLTALYGSIFYLDRILIAGRRGTAIEFFLILLCTSWFIKKWTVSGKALICILVCGFIWVTSIGAYRNAISRREGPDWQKIKEVHLIDKTLENLEKGGTELRAGAYLMQATAITRCYDYGLYHWNMLVYNYIPAQLIGREVKDSFMIKLPNPRELSEKNFGFTPEFGTTVTGLADCFGSFWYFGCLKFLIISFILGRFYLRAFQGSITSQLLYVMLITNGLHAITHHTQWFFSPFVHMSVFLLPVLYFYARISTAEYSPWRFAYSKPLVSFNRKADL